MTVACNIHAPLLPCCIFNKAVKISACTNVKEETYSLSIRIGDIKVPPPSL